MSYSNLKLCKNGHLMEPSNVTKYGGCKRCKSISQKKYKEKTVVYKWSSIKERFLAKITVDDTGCWIWQASTRKCTPTFEYGQFSFNGYPEFAHRVSYMLFKGNIPDGINVCHKCDKPLCVNPEHLFLGTQMDNIHDMANKERDAFVGIRNHNAVLNDEIVVLARQLSNEGMSFAKIAELFNVHIWTISDAIVGKTWKHITEGLCD